MSFAPAKLRLSLLLAMGVTLAAHSPAMAGEPLTLTVPAGDGDGYGISECLRSGSECGREMANALCEAHGHARAAAFGEASDVTGSIAATAPVIKAAAGDLLIRCID